MLKRAVRLLPDGVSICFLADRGFADTQLMGYLRDELGWHFRIRVKSNSWIERPGKGWIQLNQYHLALGEVVLLRGVSLTKTTMMNQLHLVLARDPLTNALWMVVSDQPTTLQTLREYSKRFQIEEELLDEKSNGFQSASTHAIRARIYHQALPFCLLSFVSQPGCLHNLPVHAVSLVAY